MESGTQERRKEFLRRAPKFARRHNVVAASLSRGVPWAGERTLAVCWSRHSAATNFDSSLFCYAGIESQCANHSYSVDFIALGHRARAYRILHVRCEFRGAHACSVLVEAFCRDELSFPSQFLRWCCEKVRDRKTVDRQHAASVRSPDLRVHT